MKRISFLLILGISFSTLTAQSVIDGLRYSQENPNGSARFKGLSGAMGALGGDFSAMAINPAGSAVFLNSSANISVGLYDNNNDATYFDTSINAIDTDIALSQAGGVFVFNNDQEESQFKKFTIGINYDLTNNFSNQVFIDGNSNMSVDQFFLAQAQGVPLNLLILQPGESTSDLYSFLGETEGVSAQNAFLGYQGFIFNPLNPDNNQNSQYVSNLGSGNYNQQYTYLTDGDNSKFTLNFGAQITDKLYFGLNLNSHTIDYRQSTFLLERNANANSTVKQIGFENNLAVLGSGFSAQIGAIAKLGENFRVGLNLDTPTYYVISEETTQSLRTVRVEDGINLTEFIAPNVINVYQDYNLRTPAKVGLSGAYIFGKDGLISFDYSFKDYSNVQFSPKEDLFFQSLNNTIENTLKSASTYRLGGEYRIQKWSLRAGTSYEESPYQNKIQLDDVLGFSTGLGYNFGNYTIDLAYSRASQDRNQRLYSTGLNTAGAVENTNSNVVFSIGFLF